MVSDLDCSGGAASADTLRLSVSVTFLIINIDFITNTAGTTENLKTFENKLYKKV